MTDFLLNFIHSAQSGYIYFGHGHEYTLAELAEMTIEILTRIHP